MLSLWDCIRTLSLTEQKNWSQYFRQKHLPQDQLMVYQWNKGSRSFRLPIRLSLLPSFGHCCLGLGWAIASHTSLCWGAAVFFSQCFSWRKIPTVGYQMHSHLFSTGIDREQWYCGKMGKFLFSPCANRSCAQHKSNLRRAAGSLPGIIWRWDGDSYQHA